MNQPSKTPPEWAVLFARGALRIGMSVPEIEQHLVAKGLSPEDANDLVMGMVEANVQQQMEPLAETERGKPKSLILSAVLGGACLLLAYWFGGGLSVGYSFIWLVPALGCIWLPALTDTEDSDWGVYTMGTGWLVLFFYLCYRIYLCIFLWVMVP